MNPRLRELKEEGKLVTIFLVLFLVLPPSFLVSGEGGEKKTVILDAVFEMTSGYPTEINNNT